MRAVIQRVEGDEVARIGAGLLCLIGIRAEDGTKDADFMKILNARLFTNKSAGRSWDHSVMQQEQEVLCVSQFTLFNIMKGNKPDFHLAMQPEQAREFYQTFVDSLRQQYSAQKVHDGWFGAMMDVSLVNDGPVTIILDSETPKG
ncbi:MAG: D-tyrosyl-tRNA(Tyr) deacylase-like [Trebouxia sp. A1-2]|nr:MAG: D-tyrosyl-tRNA(Tyr) deacylase-like [Trebouxia sp. A1-2]